MIFSIVVALMVLLVTAFWVYQGFFSGVIMFLCTVTASMLAFGFYEQVHSLWAASLNAGIGLPLALMLIFLLALLLLRLGTDKMIPDGVKLPLIVDRAGGGVCGFFTGMILVGTCLVAIQMLPIGSNVLGFERVTMAADGTPVQNGFMFKPDAFTVGLVDALSSGSFKGDTSFATAKPDFLVDLYSARDNPQAEERMIVPEDCLQVRAYWTTAQIDQVSQTASGATMERQFNTVEAGPGNKFIVCKVHLDVSAASEGSTDVRFRVPQFRIVGPPPADEGSSGPSPQVHLACGMSDLYTHKEHGLTAVLPNQASRLVRFGPHTDFLLNATTAPPVAEIYGKGENKACNGFIFDVAFEVPESFQPWYVEFKRGARVELTKKLAVDAPPSGAAMAYGSAAPKSQSTLDTSKAETQSEDSEEENGGDSTESSDSEQPAKQPGKAKVGRAPGGNVHVADAVEARTGAYDDLPIPLPKGNSLVSQKIHGGGLGECNFYIDMPTEAPNNNVVKKFFVPEDKKMVQVGADRKDALSLYGRALNYAVNVAAQIKVTDSEGKDYYAIGVYSAAPVGGKMVLEIQYYPESEQPERALSGKKAKKVTESILKAAKPDQRLFGYLFLVDPGVKIVSFSAGARNNAKQQVEIDVPK